MTIERMDNVAIVVDDLDAAVTSFTELGMKLEGKDKVKAFGRTARSDPTAFESTSR